MKISLLLPFLLLPVLADCQLPGKPLARVVIKLKRGCIDTTGKEVIPVKYDDMGYWGYGRIAVNVGGKWGYCDDEGKLVIPLQFDSARTFGDGLAGVKRNGKWGFIDTTGTMMIGPGYEDVTKFGEGLCAVRVGKRWGYIDISGKMVIPPAYDRAMMFEEGLAVVYFGDFSCGLIDKTGRRVTDTTFQYIGRCYQELVIVRDKRFKMGFMNRQGQIVVPLIYDMVEEFSQGLAAVSVIDSTEDKYSLFQKNRYSYINSKGDTIIKGPFSSADKFEDGYTVVGKGVIDGKGDTIIPFQYKNLLYVGAGFFAAGEIDVAQLIDSKGNTIMKTTNFGLSWLRYQYGLLRVWDRRLSRIGYTDIHGNWLIGARYNSVSEFESTRPEPEAGPRGIDDGPH